MYAEVEIISLYVVSSNVENRRAVVTVVAVAVATSFVFASLSELSSGTFASGERTSSMSSAVKV